MPIRLTDRKKGNEHTCASPRSNVVFHGVRPRRARRPSAACNRGAGKRIAAASSKIVSFGEGSSHRYEFVATIEKVPGFVHDGRRASPSSTTRSSSWPSALSAINAVHPPIREKDASRLRRPRRPQAAELPDIFVVTLGELIAIPGSARDELTAPLPVRRPDREIFVPHELDPRTAVDQPFGTRGVDPPTCPAKTRRLRQSLPQSERHRVAAPAVLTGPAAAPWRQPRSRGDTSSATIAMVPPAQNRRHSSSSGARTRTTPVGFFSGLR